MVLPRWLARFNRKVTNPIASRLAVGRGPFAIVVHVGRETGKTYRTPITVFETDGTYRIALTYGPGTDWVRNVMEAGECWLEYRRTLVHLTEPEIVSAADAAKHVPAVVKAALGAIGADHFLVAAG